MYNSRIYCFISANIANSILHKDKIIQVGDSFTIECKSTPNVETVHFCKLYNPKGELILTKDKLSVAPCSYEIKPFQVDNYGVWKCITGNTLTMKSVQYTFKFIEKGELC